MRIVAVSQVYLPDPTAAYLADLATHWADLGHDVTVLTATHPPVPGAVTAVRTAWASYDRASLCGRAVSQALFGTGTIRYLLRRDTLPADVLLFVGSSWIGPVVPLRIARRCVHWVHDVYPDALLALTHNRLTRFGAAVARGVLDMAWRSADRVVVLSQAMQARLVPRVERHKLDVIPLWALSDWAARHDAALAMRRARRIEEGAFVVLHHGNLGLAYDFGPLLEAAEELRENHRLVFALVGSGAQRATIEKRVAACRLGNVHFFDTVPAEALADSLAMGDVHVIALRPQWNGISYPSKLVAALAVGRPVLVTGAPDGEVARFVESAGCGFAFSRKPGELARAILELRGDVQQRMAMHVRARSACDQSFSRAAAMARWDGVVGIRDPCLRAE